MNFQLEVWGITDSVQTIIRTLKFLSKRQVNANGEYTSVFAYFDHALDAQAALAWVNARGTCQAELRDWAHPIEEQETDVDRIRVVVEEYRSSAEWGEQHASSSYLQATSDRQREVARAAGNMATGQRLVLERLMKDIKEVLS